MRGVGAARDRRIRPGSRRTSTCEGGGTGNRTDLVELEDGDLLVLRQLVQKPLGTGAVPAAPPRCATLFTTRAKGVQNDRTPALGFRLELSCLRAVGFAEDHDLVAFDELGHLVEVRGGGRRGHGRCRANVAEEDGWGCHGESAYQKHVSASGPQHGRARAAPETVSFVCRFGSRSDPKANHEAGIDPAAGGRTTCFATPQH